MNKKKTEENNSTIWLIIGLCSVILILFALWGYNWYFQKTKNFRLEIKDLKEQIKQMEDKNQQESTISGIIEGKSKE